MGRSHVFAAWVLSSLYKLECDCFFSPSVWGLSGKYSEEVGPWNSRPASRHTLGRSFQTAVVAWKELPWQWSYYRISSRASFSGLTWSARIFSRVLRVQCVSDWKEWLTWPGCAKCTLWTSQANAGSFLLRRRLCHFLEAPCILE